MNKKSDKGQQKNNQPNQQRNQNESELGIDVDEQEMNGLYGMIETNSEDKLGSPRH